MREGADRIPSGCAICGIIDRKKNYFTGNDIVKSIAVMHERSNGLGGGFAAYGIYSGYEDSYALHVFYDNKVAQESTEKCLKFNFKLELSEEIPTRRSKAIGEKPEIWRYFIKPREERLFEFRGSEDEFTVQVVMKINKQISGAYVFSSGKNMGVFKAAAFPEEVGDFYRLDEYKGYLWTAHGRFPTNTPGWWGGAHPFALLDWSVVHNGEISSYDTNRRFVEMYGYDCCLKTDTEVITYLFDLLIRKHGLSMQDAVSALAPPLWELIARKNPVEKKRLTQLRMLYGSALLNGPFSIILAASNGIIALNDRIKLRSLVAAEEKERVYVASEESAIRIIVPDPDKLWTPRGGEAVISLVDGADDIVPRQYRLLSVCDYAV